MLVVVVMVVFAPPFTEYFMPDESVPLPLPMFTFTVPAVSASTVSGAAAIFTLTA